MGNPQSIMEIIMGVLIYTALGFVFYMAAIFTKGAIINTIQTMISYYKLWIR